MTKPKCINWGCTNTVAYSSRDKHGRERYRPHCGYCQKNSYDPANFPLKEGVTRYKTGVCSNIDSHLGFPCPMDYDKAPWALGQTELDHKDGNHANNVSANVEELCKPCHAQKSKLCGDHKGFRYPRQYSQNLPCEPDPEKQD